MQAVRFCGFRPLLSPVLAVSLVSVTLLTGCLSSGGSSGGEEEEGVPPLPEAAGEVLRERYQPLGESAAIVLDTKTNLAWKRCYYGQTWSSELSACEGSARTLKWSVALSLIDSDGFRLPSLQELQSLVYCNNLHASPNEIGELDIAEGCGSPTLSPTIEPTVFPDMRQLTAWTSSASENIEGTGLGIQFGSGVLSDFNSAGADYRIILVRNPEDGDDPRAADGSRPRTNDQ